MILVVVLVTGAFGSTGPRPWALEPATIRTPNGRAAPRRAIDDHLARQTNVRDSATTIVLDSLRALGIVRRNVDRPVVGRKAYVRWWERIRALIVLAAIVVGLGVVLAAIVGVTVLGAGFLLERAIS